VAEANALTDRQREYREVYLRSEHWRETRAAALERAEHRCQVCNSAKQLDVHHRTYERLGEERPADLTVLCRTCHDRHHRNYNVVSLAPKKPKKARAKQTSTSSGSADALIAVLRVIGPANATTIAGALGWKRGKVNGYLGALKNQKRVYRVKKNQWGVTHREDLAAMKRDVA
jgi:hypothetical protein